MFQAFPEDPHVAFPGVGVLPDRHVVGSFFQFAHEPFDGVGGADPRPLSGGAGGRQASSVGRDLARGFDRPRGLATVGGRPVEPAGKAVRLCLTVFRLLGYAGTRVRDLRSQSPRARPVGAGTQACR